MEPDKLTRLLCELVIPYEANEPQAEARRELSPEEIDEILEECFRDFDRDEPRSWVQYSTANEPAYSCWLTISSILFSIASIAFLVCFMLNH